MRRCGFTVGWEDHIHGPELASEDPEGGPWRDEPLTVVVEAVTHGALGRAAGGRGVVLAVEGRSPSGKTTLAARLQEAVKGSAVVHTPMTSRGGTLATGH